jgi:gluconate 5-dehydrogenase
MMNAFRIDGQRAVITGGGSGLGFGIAKVFIEAGAEVIIIGRNEEKLRVAQQQLGERCSYRAFDVTQLDKIPTLVEEIGTVDILVNCAGTHLKKWEDIGYAALYLSSPAGSYVNGAFLPVDAGASEAF